MQAAIVNTVKQSADSRCHATSCSDSGCSLQMQGVPQPFVLVGLEHQHSPANKTQSHCDYLFVGGVDGKDGGPWLAPVELTTGKKKPSDLLDQLRGGASIAAKLLPTAAQVRFLPIFAHNGGFHRNDINVLRANTSKVRLGNVNRSVALVRCGTRLADALTF